MGSHISQSVCWFFLTTVYIYLSYYLPGDCVVVVCLVRLPQKKKSNDNTIQQNTLKNVHRSIPYRQASALSRPCPSRTRISCMHACMHCLPVVSLSGDSIVATTKKSNDNTIPKKWSDHTFKNVHRSIPCRQALGGADTEPF
jgi:hypothetical protein